MNLPIAKIGQDRGLAVCSVLALIANFLWFDLLVRAVTGMGNYQALGIPQVDGLGCFLFGMLSVSLVAAFFPKWFELNEKKLAVLCTVIGVAAVVLYLCSTFTFDSPWLAGLAVAVNGFSNVAILLVDTVLIAHIVDRRVLCAAIVLVFGLHCMLLYASDCILSGWEASVALVTLPLIGLALTVGAYRSICPDTQLSWETHVKFRKPLSTAMFGLLTLAFASFAITATASRAEPWSIGNGIGAEEVPAVFLGFFLYLALSFITLIKAKANLLFRFLPGLFVLFIADLVLCFGLGTWALPQSAMTVLAFFSNVFAETFAWVVAVHAIRSLGTPPYRVIGCALAIESLVEIVIHFLVSRDNGSTPIVVTLGILAVFAVLVWSLYQLHRSDDNLSDARCETCPYRPQTSCGQKDDFPAEHDETALDPTRNSYMEIAARYGLSSRETEVFMLLAQGRSRRYISDELFIAEGTVANHTGRVYEKLGVHSKQELLSLVHPKQEGNAQTTKPVAGGPRSPENE